MTAASMRCACIDIGSNTTRLLVADWREGRLLPIAQRRAFTRLGRRVGLTGEIDADAISEVARTVAEQAAVAREHSASALRIVATAAIRTARNRDDLLAAVRGSCGEELVVLSPEDEARLAFDGAVVSLADPPEGEIAVVDVGGGSTEFATGTRRGGVTWSASVDVGSGWLTDEHVRHDPPAAAEIAKLRAAAAAAFAHIGPRSPELAVAAGGSATSLGRLVGGDLDLAGLRAALGVLGSDPADEVAARLGLDPGRVRLLPAGIVLLEEAAHVLGGRLRIGGGGLREGVVRELASLCGVSGSSP